MTGFRLLLAAIFLTIVVYTSVVVADHGLGLLPAFFGGGPLLTGYLFAASFTVSGDFKALLLGSTRAKS